MTRVEIDRRLAAIFRDVPGVNLVQLATLLDLLASEARQPPPEPVPTSREAYVPPVREHRRPRERQR